MNLWTKDYNIVKSLYNTVDDFLLQFSRTVLSESLRPCGLQHDRLPCPSPTLELAQTHVHRIGDAIQRGQVKLLFRGKHLVWKM